MKINHSKPYFDITDQKAVLKVLQDQFASNGPQAKDLGEKGACLLGKKFGIPTQSGTDAITAALKILKLKPGTKVAVPAYICNAPLDALAICGCVPVPIDIEKESFGISISQTNEKKDLGAVIAAHLFGIAAPFYELENHNVIEDCAQTLAISIDDHKVGSMGKFAVCSFYATKLLTTGHGGLIAIDEEALYSELQYLFSHDKQDEWDFHFHFLMSDLNAALGVAQISKIHYMLAERRKIASRFLQSLGNKNGLVNSVYSRFLVISEGNTEKIIKKFNQAGIEVKRPVFKPVFQYLKLDKRNFPNSQWAHEKIISVPIYPGMTESETEAIETFLEGNRHELRSWPPA